MVYATRGPRRRNGPAPGSRDGPKALGSRIRGPSTGGPNGPAHHTGYTLVLSASIAAISSSDSRPGVGMLNFVIAKRNTT